MVTRHSTLRAIARNVSYHVLHMYVFAVNSISCASCLETATGLSVQVA